MLGTYDLQLSHNTRTDTTAYEQKNSMTQIHWGSSIEHIKDANLLGSTLKLYRAIDEENKFILVFE